MMFLDRFPLPSTGPARTVIVGQDSFFYDLKVAVVAIPGQQVIPNNQDNTRVLEYFKV